MESKEQHLINTGFQKVEYIQFHPSGLRIYKPGFSDGFLLADETEEDQVEHFHIFPEQIKKLFRSLDIYFDNNFEGLSIFKISPDGWNRSTQEIYAKVEGLSLLTFVVHMKSDPGKDEWESWVSYTYKGDFTICWGEL
jgi:hypothetical protein